MNVEFEKEYLAELYEKGKTDDKKHRFQPQIVNGYFEVCQSSTKYLSNGRFISVQVFKL